MQRSGTSSTGDPTLAEGENHPGCGGHAATGMAGLVFPRFGAERPRVYDREFSHRC